MTLTEEEAGKKWCPFARVIHQNGDATMFTAANSFGDGERSIATRCITSECMAWRAGPEPRERRRVYKGETMENGAPIVRAGTLVVIDGKQWRYEYSDVDDRGEFDLVHRAMREGTKPTGYCGLAGSP